MAERKRKAQEEMQRLEEEEARLEREEKEKKKRLANVEIKPAEEVKAVEVVKKAETDEAEKREKARSAEERAKEQEEKARQAAWGTRLAKSTPSSAAVPPSAGAPTAARPKSPVSAGRMRSDDMPRDTARVRPGSPGGKWKHDERSAEPPRRAAAVSLALPLVERHKCATEHIGNDQGQR